MMLKTFSRLSLLLLAFCALASSIHANKKPPEAPVNLNTATSEELQLVPGIGPVTAEKILQMRKNYGAFKSVDDLRAVRGIGPKRLEKMRKYLTVGKTTGAKPGTPTLPAKTGAAMPPPGPSSAKTASPPTKSAPPAKPETADDPPCVQL